MSPIDVEPAVYDAASKVFGEKVVHELTNAVVGLRHSLADTGAMAGSDPGGMSWARSYDPAAAETAGAMTDLTNACYKIAAMLEQTGFNHGMANSASDPTRGTPTPADTTRYEAPSTLGGDPDPPSAAGGSGHPPTGWGLIEDLVGYVWPNGDQGKLRKAAQAWNTAADTLNGGSFKVPEAIGSITTQQSPEVQDAQTVCQTMMTDIQDVSTICRNLSTACSDLADHIDKAHKDVEDELISLVEWTVAIEAAGAAASFFSFGFAEVPAQAAEVARIGATATRVSKILSTLVEFAGTVASRVSSAVTKIAEIAGRLKAILGAKLSKALTTVANSVSKLTGNPAFDRLSVWAQDWSARGFEIEKQLGGNLPKSFPTVDKWENGVATSIKSVDLSAPTYQNSSALASKLRGYVDSVAGFDGATWSRVTIDDLDITGRALQVGIQPGVESAAQRAVFDQIQQYATSKGVKLIISEVP